MLENFSINDTNSAKKIEILANHPEYGKLLKAEKSFGFSTNINNGITKVDLPYALTFEKGEYSVQVTIVDRGNGFEIFSIN